MRARRGRTSEKGVALFLAMLCLLILTILGLALLFGASTEQTLAGNETKISKAFYAASSGIDYATVRLAVDRFYAGGAMPVGVSSHYPGVSAPDIEVVLARPIVVGHGIHPGDQIEPHGNAYGTTQIVEIYYKLSSTARSGAIHATRSVAAEVGVYPSQLTLPPVTLP